MTEPIIGWARPLRYDGEPYHGVTAIVPSGSVQTSCNGRWSSTSEPWDYIEGRDRSKDDEGRTFKKCGACDDFAKEQRTHDGLKELRAATTFSSSFVEEFRRRAPCCERDRDGDGNCDRHSALSRLRDFDLGGES